MIMNITRRTFQNHKDKGLLPYSKLNRKNYSKRSDVQALLEAGQPYNTNDNGFTDEWHRRSHRATGDDNAVGKPYWRNIKHYRSVMKGEMYRSTEDVWKLLHISKHTLQQYRWW